MINKQKIIASSALIVIVLFFIGLVSFGIFLQTPDSFQKLSAFSMGAEYLGRDGVTLQTKQNNCGPAALKMIFDRYNISVTIDEIDQNIALTEKGSSMLALKEMAELKGLKAEGWKLTLEDFLTQQFPVLLFVHNNHFIVVDSVSNNEIFVRDPAIGRLKINKKKLQNIWNGETLILIKIGTEKK